MKKIWLSLLSLLSKLCDVFFGQLNWTSPPWIQHVNASRHEKPRTFWSVVILLVFSVFVGLKGYQYFQSLPKDITLIAQIRPLKLTENIEKASPDNLTISFSYDLS